MKIKSSTSSLASAIALFVGAITLPAAEKNGPATIVYVESNKAAANSILAYQRDAQGRLTPLGEFPTGGQGVFDLSLDLGPFDSDQDLIVNAEHTLLFAVNSGSDTIAVFNIQADGRLTPVAGSPFPSGGANPVSVGLARETLVVVNKAMDPARPALNQPNYATFHVMPNGALAGPLSTSPAVSGSSPTQADLSPGKRLVFDAQFLGGMLRSFFIEAAGTLTPIDLQPLPASEFAGSSAPRAPLGLWSHPRQPILYVGFVTINRLGVYTYDAVGHLTFVRTVPNSGTAICWLRNNEAGTRLYTSNTGDGSVSVYDTTAPLAPVEIQKLKLKGVGNPLQLDLDPRGDFLYVITQRADDTIPLGTGNSLHALKVNATTGRLTETGNSSVALPVPPGTRPQGVVVVQTREQ